MCLILISYRQNADFPLIVAANRDEFYARPTAALDWWADAPQILGGADISRSTPVRAQTDIVSGTNRGHPGPLVHAQTDVVSGANLGHPSPLVHAQTDIVSGANPEPPGPWGGWLAVNRQGRFAAVTNFREPGKDSKSAKSRGLIVRRFLYDRVTMPDFIHELTQTAREYNGYNLLFGSASELWHFNNRSGEPPAQVQPGLHVLSNATLNSPWPKALLAKQLYAQQTGNPPSPQDIFAMLADSTQADQKTVQRTGLPLKYEIALSSIFIALKIRRGFFRRKVGYGTRASSYVTFSHSGDINFNERTYAEGKPAGDRRVLFKAEAL